MTYHTLTELDAQRGDEVKHRHGNRFEGWWHIDEGAAGPGMCSRGYVNGELYDTLQTERHADGEYIGHLQARVEELEAALRDVDGELWDHGFAADGGMRSTIRAALTPPEQQ